MSAESAVLEVMGAAEAPELLVPVKEAGLSIESANGLLSVFAPFAKEARSLIAQSKNVTDEKLAGAFRKRLKACRVAIENTRKATKDESKRTGDAIDGMAKVLRFLIEPEEERLEAIEKAEQIKEAARKAKLKVDRENALKPFGLDTSFYQLGDMPDETFAQLLENTRAAHEIKLAAARKAEEDRIRAENERLKEEARIREENEKLKREAEVREAAAKAERERMERERVESEERMRKEREAAEAERRRIEAESAAKLAEERRKAEEARRIAEEKARQERQAAEKAAAAERARVAEEQRVAAEKARIDRELLERKAAEEKAAREKLEAEARAAKEAAEKKAAEEAEAARKAALAPDKERLLACASELRQISIPTLASDEGRGVTSLLSTKIEKLAAWIEQEAAVL